jgi:hypothetical protein
MSEAVDASSATGAGYMPSPIAVGLAGMTQSAAQPARSSMLSQCKGFAFSAATPVRCDRTLDVALGDRR